MYYTDTEGIVAHFDFICHSYPQVGGYQRYHTGNYLRCDMMNMSTATWRSSLHVRNHL
jgi:hypothetical protein